MGDDPIFQIGLPIAFLLILTSSILLSKKKPKYIFIIPLISLRFALPMFLFSVIMHGSTFISIIAFYVSMILWTASSIVLFIDLLIYIKKEKDLKKQKNIYY